MGHQKLWIAILTAWDTIWPSTKELAATLMASSGHLRRCSDAGTTHQCLSPWDTIWPSTKELAATQMASSGHLRRCSVGYTSNQCLSRDKDASILSWPTIMGHHKLWIAILTGGIRYGRQLRSEELAATRWPHQVTYDVVATP
eukprot:scaffold9002_cov84-Skeletonema_dohrnii-CCMP3373.AAC.4